MEASFFSNHSANENVAKTKILPPCGEEGHSSNENAELKSHHNCSANQNAGI